MQEEALREETRHSVDQLGRQVGTFDGKIRELIASNPGTNQRYRILLSIPGVGPVSAAAPCCWMPELGQLGNRQAATHLGVTPFARDSGQRHSTRPDFFGFTGEHRHVRETGITAGHENLFVSLTQQQSDGGATITGAGRGP